MMAVYKQKSAEGHKKNKVNQWSIRISDGYEIIVTNNLISLEGKITILVEPHTHTHTHTQTLTDVTVKIHSLICFPVQHNYQVLI